MPHYSGPNPFEGSLTFAEKLLMTMRTILKRSNACPECQMQVGTGGLHGQSQIYIGADCHLGQLMREAEEAGLLP